MLDLRHVEISTKRLLLKPISMRYKKQIFSEFTGEISTYMYACPAIDITETEYFIKSSLRELKNGTNLQLVVLAKKSQEFLGCASLHDLDQEPRLGIWLKKSAQGNKYGLEVIMAIKEWADENLDYEYLLYGVDKENIASQKIVEAMGGKIQNKYEMMNLSGNILHILEYKIYKNSLPF